MTDHAAAHEQASASSNEEEIRRSVLSHLEHGRTYDAMHAARTLLEKQPGRRTHRFLRDTLDATAASATGLKQLKVALLSSFSIEFVQDSLVALGLLGGMRIEIYRAGFGPFRQELLVPVGALYSWSPDVVSLCVSGGGLVAVGIG